MPLAGRSCELGVRRRFCAHALGIDRRYLCGPKTSSILVEPVSGRAARSWDDLGSCVSDFSIC
jgi:hypothetical protein